jgi:3-(3-hydroxy-phenyl)propionate hydroxylase
MKNQSANPSKLPVLIAGGGPVGFTLAALLARHGVRSVVIEADEGYCTGSRAICVSRRSQEIMGWVGADAAVSATGLPWAGGRSYWRGQEVLHFTMPHEPTQRFAPMVNIQQYYIEEFAHQAAQRLGDWVDVRWQTKVLSVNNLSDGPEVTVQGPDGVEQVIKADYLVACDGGRSTVREQLGLQLEGVQYDGKYVIVDIEQTTKRDVERLAWFDPPSNPGSTILMHRQPGNVWRVDYQVRDDEDPIEAVKPENVLPRVQSHLDMIGETAPWKPLWISIYNAKCLTLPSYQYGRTLFAGDAGHLVPIFGVRGLNSGLDDAGNLAWKLAAVLQGQADAKLLHSYSTERVHATRENIAYGAKSTEFMAPPNYGFTLMRQAALRLASVGSEAKSLINPRQSTPVEYLGSPLNLASVDIAHAARPGMPAPEALVSIGQGTAYLSQYYGQCFVLLVFTDQADGLQPLHTLPKGQGVAALKLLRVACKLPNGAVHSAEVVVDHLSQATLRYAAAEGTTLLVRPDGYIAARWAQPDRLSIQQYLQTYRVHSDSEATA